MIEGRAIAGKVSASKKKKKLAKKLKEVSKG